MTQEENRQRLDNKAAEICARVYETEENAISENAVTLVLDLVLAAARYWYGFDVDDFCVQHVGPETMVFGSTNRLVWSAATGFRADASYCNEKFLANARAIGPCPTRG